MAHEIAETSIAVIQAAPATRWILVTLTGAGGGVGYGEASLNGQEDAVLAAFKVRAGSLVGSDAETLPGKIAGWTLPTLADAAAASALDQAAWDLSARQSGMTLAAALGGARRQAVGVYANINRRTRDRSPAGFVASAVVAREAGHAAFKIAPFDEADPGRCARGEGREAVTPGLARIEAVRAAIGDRRLMVDCHWRLDVRTAAYVIDAAAALGLYWVECPLPETPENLAAIRALRERANRHGVKLAGCETMVREEGFRPFLDAGAYDVIMPDVKYAGGLRAVLALEEQAMRAGTAISLHNPTGPVCHAASLHVSAALHDPDLLEMQFDETPLFEALQSTAVPAARGGAIDLPTEAGLGLQLDAQTLRRASVTFDRFGPHHKNNEERKP